MFVTVLTYTEWYFKIGQIENLCFKQNLESRKLTELIRY